MPVLIVQDSKSEAVWGEVVPTKGDNRHAIMRLSNIIKLSGHKGITIRSDQEPSIMMLKRAVQKGM